MITYLLFFHDQFVKFIRAGVNDDPMEVLKSNVIDLSLLEYYDLFTWDFSSKDRGAIKCVCIGALL